MIFGNCACTRKQKKKSTKNLLQFSRYVTEIERKKKPFRTHRTIPFTFFGLTESFASILAFRWKNVNISHILHRKTHIQVTIASIVCRFPIMNFGSFFFAFCSAQHFSLDFLWLNAFHWVDVYRIDCISNLSIPECRMWCDSREYSERDKRVHCCKTEIVQPNRMEYVWNIE